MKTEVDRCILSRLPMMSANDVIRQALKIQSKSEVQTATLQLSLRCPISFARMEVPIRLVGCKHLQCMDESSWRAYESSLSFGKKLCCPICNRLLDNAVEAFIDGYTLDILRNTDPKVYEVTLDMEANLKWTPMPPEETDDESEPDANPFPVKKTPVSRAKRSCSKSRNSFKPHPEIEIEID